MRKGDKLCKKVLLLLTATYYCCLLLLLTELLLRPHGPTPPILWRDSCLGQVRGF